MPDHARAAVEAQVLFIHRDGRRRQWDEEIFHPWRRRVCAEAAAHCTTQVVRDGDGFVALLLLLHDGDGTGSAFGGVGTVAQGAHGKSACSSCGGDL